MTTETTETTTTPTESAATSKTATEHLDLPIEGMTCASCARRIEKRLNKVDGVDASVNYATERASVDFDPARIDLEGLAAVVAETGYQAVLPRPLSTGDASDDDTSVADPTASLRRRLIVSAALTVPVLAISMIPALQFDFWQRLVLQLATPVVVWGAWPFHKAAWATCATARPPWTPSSRSAPSRRGRGRWWPCSSSAPASPTCAWASTSASNPAPARRRSTSRWRRR